MTDTYRGWSISFDYGYFNAVGPNFDASWEGEEDGWVGNGETATARTREGLIEEIDAWFVEAAIADTHPKDGDVEQAPLVSGGGAGTAIAQPSSGDFA